MTAEIAIMNKSGVALAADSAASIITSRGDTKIYNTNKLFMLSKYHSVGVMVYGSAELMSVPWETIIKIHRKELKDSSFKTLQEYAANFITYLNNNTFLFPRTEQEDYVYGISYSSFSEIELIIDRKVEEETHKGLKVSTADINKIVNRVIKTTFDFFVGLSRLPTLPTTFEKEILSKYYKIIEQAIDDVFGKYNLTPLSRKRLRRIGVGLFVKDTFTVRDTSNQELISSSGIVIAGFGEDDLYPVLVSYEIESVINDTLKFKEGFKHSVKTTQSAAVLPFAQKEMVLGFMTGIQPNYREALEGYLNEVFDKYPSVLVKKLTHITSKARRDLAEELKKDSKTLASTFWDSINEWSTDNNVNPILRSVSFLPIDELASMAESLVNLTSFKRRVTLVPETVSGPIDVAVISKADGFVWIKRKHYFEAAKNPHFLKNYYR